MARPLLFTSAMRKLVLITIAALWGCQETPHPFGVPSSDASLADAPRVGADAAAGEGRAVDGGVSVEMGAPDGAVDGESGPDTSSDPPIDYVLYQDFDDVELSTGDDTFTYDDGTPIDGPIRGLTPELAKALFDCGGTMDPAAGVHGPFETGMAHYSMAIVRSPDGDTSRGNVLRTFRDADGIRTTDGVDPPAGGQIRMADNHPDAGTWTRMFMSAELYTPAINPFTGAPPQPAKSRKLPIALFSERLNFEGVRTPSEPTDGWSVRGILIFKKGYPNKEDWMPTDYVYDRNKFQKVSMQTLDRASANNWPRDEVLALPGQWYKMTIYVALESTPGAKDGKLRLFFGKVGGAQHLISARDNMAYGIPGDPKHISGNFALWGYGGGDLSFAVQENQFTYWDNFIMTTSKPADIAADDLL